MRWYLLIVVKVAALMGACGGPLFIFDTFKQSHDRAILGPLTFAPIALMIFGAYSLIPPSPDKWDRAMLVVGALGAALLLATNCFAGYHLVSGTTYYNTGLVTVGIVIGTSSSLIYLALAGIRLRRNAVQLAVQRDGPASGGSAR